MEIANSAAELFPHMQLEEKRELISLVLSNPVIEDASIRYDYKKPFDMFVDMENIENGGEQGIRTLETFRFTRFPSVRLRPLGQFSAL